jgi:hypothetical protein
MSFDESERRKDSGVWSVSNKIVAIGVIACFFLVIGYFIYWLGENPPPPKPTMEMTIVDKVVINEYTYCVMEDSEGNLYKLEYRGCILKTGSVRTVEPSGSSYYFSEWVQLKRGEVGVNATKK